MAVERNLKLGVRLVVEALRRYAAAQGWSTADYRVLIETNAEWGRIHAILVARSFPGETLDDQWASVIDFLDEELKEEPGLMESLNLVLRTFDEVDEGGIYAIPPSYDDAEGLIASTVIR